MHWQNVHIKAIVRPLRGRFYYLAVKPQVSFATLSSPAVMDIRRLRRRLLEINDHNIQAKVQQNEASTKWSISKMEHQQIERGFDLLL